MQKRAYFAERNERARTRKRCAAAGSGVQRCATASVLVVCVLFNELVSP